MSHTQLEKCLEGMINVYHQYSIRTEHHDMLSRGELRKMIEEQLHNLMKNKKDPKAIDRIFEELDQDKNGQLAFEETVVFFVRLLIATHDHIHGKEGQGQGGGHGHGHSHDH